MQKFLLFLWRLSILLIPWQTRWIFVDGKIGAFSWEQGTVSFYLSWLPLLITVAIVGWMRWKGEGLGVQGAGRRGAPRVPEFAPRAPAVGDGQASNKTMEQWNNGTIRQYSNTTSRKPRSIILLKFAFILILVASIFTVSPTATFVWWLSVLVIGGFAWALREMRVSGREIGVWIVIATIPHAVLGIWQFFTQAIPGSTFLGIAEHDPIKSGTSVVEHGLYRVLRVYGGFPHPNILGGWIAVSLAFLPELIRSAKTKMAIYGWLAAGFTLVSALVFTFSRGAWLAAALAFAAASLIAFFASREKADRQAVALLAIVCAIAAGFGLVTQWDHVKSRAPNSPERLEMWSVFSRTESFVQGWRAFTLRPIAGWGPGASMLGIKEASKGTLLQNVAPEPPHAAPAAFLLETGIFGILALVVLAWALVQEVRVWKLGFWTLTNQTPNPKPKTLPLIIAFVVIALTDHYLVTLWPGIALFGLLVVAMASHDADEVAGRAI